MNKVSEALRWIANILNEHKIPWQITGGLAARTYGATRPINDIDIDIPEDRFEAILNNVRPYIVEGPARTDNPVWDVYGLYLEYNGQEIDIGGAHETRIKDLKTGLWHHVKTDLSKAEPKILFGISVPVVDKQDLIEYKQHLAMPGNHHEQDIQEMLASAV